MEVWFSSIAKEDLINNSVYIKESDGVRNIRYYLDLHSELCVFVSNVVPSDSNEGTKSVIQKGAIVRCIKVRT